MNQRIFCIRHSLAASCIALASAASTPALAQDDKGQLGEIVVTAQRVDQKLQDVPASVTAFSSETIDRMQISTAQDLSRLIPNTKFDPVTGGSTGLKPYIRGGGVTDGGIVVSESEVGIYQDNVYRARLSASLIDFVELERIEVLRGPQGVLYGRNSSAGAVNFITKTPGDTLKGTVQAGYGTWNERRLKGYITGPISQDGKWRASLNGLIRARDGGRQFNVTLDKAVGAEKFQGVQGDLAYVGDAVDGRLTLFYSHSDGDGQWAVPNSVSANGMTITPTTGSYRRVASPVESYTDVEQYGATLKLAADFPGGKLTSITGYSELNDDWRQDFSGGVDAALLGIPGGGKVALFDRISGTDQWQFSQELQAAGGVGDTIDYVAGLYFFTESGSQDILSTIFFGPSRTIFNAKTASFAGFGQVTVHLTEALSLVLGGRYTIDDKKLTGTIGTDSFNLSNSYERFTPKAGVDYKLTPDILLYASYSEGFKSGGYNGLAGTLTQISTPFLPQYTKAYETGIKADLFDRSVRLNLVGFINKIQNRQQSLTVASGPSIGTFIVENYDATLKGIELEAMWRVATGLTLWGNGAIDDGKYTGCSTEAIAACSILANEPPVFPDYSFTIGFDYEVALGNGSLRLGSDYSARDSYFSTADNVLIGAVPKQDFLNGYIGYDLGPWSFQVNGKNILQEKGWQTGFGFALVQPRFSIEPRTLLGTVRYSF